MCPTDCSVMPWKKLCFPTIYIEDHQWIALTLRSIMWRTMKINVENVKLHLPPQIAKVESTRLAPVERYRYCPIRGEILLFQGTPQTRNVWFVVYSRAVLINLRQACCNTNIEAPRRRLLMTDAIRSKMAKRRENIDQKFAKAENPMRMSQLPSSLLPKIHTDCQKFYRKWITYLHGLTGIRLQLATAHEAWELKVTPVLSVITVYQERLHFDSSIEHLEKVDIIQRMYFLFNLAQAFEKDGFIITKLLSKPT